MLFYFKVPFIEMLTFPTDQNQDSTGFITGDSASESSLDLSASANATDSVQQDTVIIEASGTTEHGRLLSSMFFFIFPDTYFEFTDTSVSSLALEPAEKADLLQSPVTENIDLKTFKFQNRFGMGIENDVHQGKCLDNKQGRSFRGRQYLLRELGSR